MGTLQIRISDDDKLKMKSFAYEKGYKDVTAYILDYCLNSRNDITDNCNDNIQCCGHTLNELRHNYNDLVARYNEVVSCYNSLPKFFNKEFTQIDLKLIVDDLEFFKTCSKHSLLCNEENFIKVYSLLSYIYEKYHGTLAGYPYQDRYDSVHII